MRMKRVEPKGLYRKEGSIVAANTRANMINLSNGDSFNRLLLCASAQKQFVCLEDPEPARVDSLYTPGLTYESTHNIYYDKDLEVLHVLEKEILGRKTSMKIIILKDKDGMIYTHIHNDFIATAEDYGYKNDGFGGDCKVGDIIEKDVFVQKPDIFSPSGLCWGKNLYTIYNISGHTLEDAIRIDKRAADRIKLCKVMPLTLVLNSRDRLKDLYGDDIHYKPFPLIGDKVRDDKLVCGIQVLEKNSQILTTSKMLREFAHNDVPKYMSAGATCIDIDVFANNVNIIPNDLCKDIYLDCKNFYTSFIDIINELKREYTEFDYYTNYYYDYYKALYIDNTGIMQPNGQNVYASDTYVINMTFQKYEPITIGQKMSGMHGDKGVVSDIDTPEGVVYELYEGFSLQGESGRVVDVVTNCAGVPNRSNNGQLGEKYINNIADGIIRYHSDPARRDLDMMYEDMLSLLIEAAPEQHDILKELCYDREKAHQYMLDIIENDFIIYTNPWPEECHHPAYVKNNAERFEELYKKFVIKRPEYYGFIGKERIYMNDNGNLIPTNIYAEISRKYFVFLEYTAEKKFGVCTRSFYDRKGGLSKTSKKKDRESPYGGTPIRLGVRDIVIITSNFINCERDTLVKFMLTTDSDIVDTFKAYLGQINIEIDYSPETIEALRRIVASVLKEKEEEVKLDLI